MECPSCGNDVSHDDYYCSDCGASLNSVSDQPEAREEDTNDNDEDSLRDVVTGFGFGLPPALGAEILVLFTIGGSSGLVFILALAGFVYQYHSEVKLAASRMFFWLGVEALLVPISFFAFAVRTNETVIVSLVWIVVSALVGIPVAAVLYLISRRLEKE